MESKALKKAQKAERQARTKAKKAARCRDRARSKRALSARPPPSLTAKTICITGWFADRHHMMLLIHLLGWKFHPRVRRDTSNIVIGHNHDLTAIISSSFNLDKANPNAARHLTFEFLHPYFPPDL